MSEKAGHFENGIWIEEREPPTPQADRDAFEKRLSEATKAVITSIDNVMVVTHDLVNTDEGRQYIEKSIREAERQIQLSLDAIVGRVRAEVERTKAGLEKKAAELEKKVKR
jgi:hypothetical protein